MSKSKLISLLSTFTKEEWADLKKFVLSKTRKESENYRVLTFLEKKKEKLNTISLDELLAKYPSSCSRKVFLNILSKLHGWTESWLTVNYQLKNFLLQKSTLVKVYNKKGLFDEADRLTKRLLKDLDSVPITLEKQEIKAELLTSIYYSNNPLKRDREFDLFHKMIQSNLELSKGRIDLFRVELINYRDFWRTDVSEDLEHLNKLSNLLKEDDNSPLITYLFRIVNYQGAEDFEPLLNRLKRRPNINSRDIIQELCVAYLYNYSIRYWTKGLLKNKELLFEIVDFGLQSGAFLQKDKIPSTRFHNIVMTLAATGSFEETDTFIQFWYRRVDTAYIEDSRSLARACNAFYNHRYEEILPLLRNVKTDDWQQKVKIKAFELVALFKSTELKHDLFYNACKNFKRMLRNNKEKLSQKVIDSNLSFIHVLEKLADVNRDLENIRLEDYPSLIYRKWIMDEINALKKTG